MGAQLGAGEDGDGTATAPRDVGEMSLRERHLPCFEVMKFAAGTADSLVAQEKHHSQPSWQSADPPAQRQRGHGSASPSCHAAFGNERWTRSIPVCRLSEAALPAVGSPVARRVGSSSVPPRWHRGCVTSAGGVLAGFGGETAPSKRLAAQTRLLSSVTDVLATSSAQLKASQI